MGATISVIFPRAIVTVIVDTEVDLVVGLVEVCVPSWSLPDIDLWQPLGGAFETFRDGVHPKIAVKARALAVGVVRNLKAGFPVTELLNELGILGCCAAGLQRGAGSARRPHLKTIGIIESASLVVLSTRVGHFSEHVPATRFSIEVQAAPVGAAGAAVPLVRINRAVLRELVIERYNPMLAARWGYAKRVGAGACPAQGSQQ